MEIGYGGGFAEIELLEDEVKVIPVFELCKLFRKFYLFSKTNLLLPACTSEP